MPVIQINDQQHPLKLGTTRVGTGPEADLPIGGTVDAGVQAVVEVGADRRAAVRRADAEAVVRVNGVVLGAEPVPLLHGDRLEVLGHELRFADDAQAGTTRAVDADAVAQRAAARQSARRATAATGGRLVSLVDGKEYQIPEAGVTIGREATCDIVVPQHAVSRRHAQIVPGPEGYTLVDLSANGVLVNGVRIVQSHLLARADVVRIGSEELRFSAPVAEPAAGAAETPPAPAPVTGPPPMSVPSLAHTVAGVPAARVPQPARTPPPAPEAAQRSLPSWLWLVVAALLAAGAYFVMQGR